MPGACLGACLRASLTPGHHGARLPSFRHHSRWLPRLRHQSTPRTVWLTQASAAPAMAAVWLLRAALKGWWWWGWLLGAPLAQVGVLTAHSSTTVSGGLFQATTALPPLPNEGFKTGSPPPNHIPAPLPPMDGQGSSLAASATRHGGAGRWGSSGVAMATRDVTPARNRFLLDSSCYQPERFTAWIFGPCRRSPASGVPLTPAGGQTAAEGRRESRARRRQI